MFGISRTERIDRAHGSTDPTVTRVATAPTEQPPRVKPPSAAPLAPAASPLASSGGAPKCTLHAPREGEKNGGGRAKGEGRREDGEGKQQPLRDPFQPERITVGQIVGLATAYSVRHSARNLHLGKLAHLYAAQHRDTPRTTAMAEIKAGFAAAGLTSDAAKLNEYVGAWWVAEYFGLDEAKTLAYAVLRLFVRFLRPCRREGGKREIHPKYAERVPPVWSRAVHEQLSAAVVKALLDEVRPPRPKTLKLKSLKERILAEARRLTPAELAEVVATLEHRLQHQQPAPRAA
jgi:hypothetical protein